MGSNRPRDVVRWARIGHTPSRAEIVVAVLTVASWAAMLLQLTNHLNWPPPWSYYFAVIALASTVITFVVSSRQHERGRRPRSVLGKLIAWAVILAAIAAIGYLLFLGWALRDWTF